MGVTARQFWMNPRLWPGEMPGFVFLARAVMDLGERRFGAEWTGEEPWRAVPPLLPVEQPIHDRRQMAYAHRLIGTALGQLGPQPPVPLSSPPLIMSAHEWELARAKNAVDAAQATAAAYRWDSICEITTSLFKIGALHCYLRPIAGGRYEGPLEPMVWNNENNQMRFELCQFNVGSPYHQANAEAHNRIRANSYSQQDYRYLFVEAKSLANSLNALEKITDSHALPAGQSGPHDRSQKKFSIRSVAEFRNEVMAAVRTSPERPPEGTGRAYFIMRGRKDYNLPKRKAEAEYKAALECVGREVAHGWSNLGRRPRR